MASISRASSMTLCVGGHDLPEQISVANMAVPELGLRPIQRNGSFASASTLKSKFSTKHTKKNKKRRKPFQLFCGLDRLFHRQPSSPESNEPYHFNTHYKGYGKAITPTVMGNLPIPQKTQEIDASGGLSHNQVDSKESGYSTMFDFTGTDNSSSLDECWGGARPKIRSALLDVSTAERRKLLLRKITEGESESLRTSTLDSATKSNQNAVSMQQSQQELAEDTSMVSVATQCSPVPPPRKNALVHQTTSAESMDQSGLFAQLMTHWAQAQAVHAFLLLTIQHMQQQHQINQQQSQQQHQQSHLQQSHQKQAPQNQQQNVLHMPAHHRLSVNSRRSNWVNSEHRISEILQEYPAQLQQNIHSGVRNCSACSQRGSNYRMTRSRKPDWLRRLEARRISRDSLDMISDENTATQDQSRCTPRLTLTPSSPTYSTMSTFTRGAISAQDDWSSTHSDDTQQQPVSVTSVPTLQGIHMVADEDSGVTYPQDGTVRPVNDSM